MIFNSLREKSIKKIIDRHLGERETLVKQGKEGIRSLAVIINYDELVDYRPLMNLAAALGVNNEEVYILGYVDKVHRGVNYMIPVFSRGDIGQRGKLKSFVLNDFLQREYDLQINYFTDQAAVEMLLVAALCKADFKAGISGEVEELNDLVLHLPEGDFSGFQNELIRYLKILKKI
ncbi:DUF6913 domain-containing protein [Robertkochia aurantiaca]|uniref:DUF6913 domain-containing protein n=1 Tax=Robertkochia aurantiaca TaxID=2873700 RepID=UPI001CCB2728|nr:hypothetical protein [Robertkochia sp. 3YJGBD-33]